MKLSKSKSISLLLSLALTASSIAVPASGAKANAEELPPPVSGTQAYESLKTIIDSTFVDNPDDQQTVRIQKKELAEPKELAEAFAANFLLQKDSKLKFAAYDLNKDDCIDLLAVYPNKLEIYTAGPEMIGRMESYTPNVTIKNIKEIRKGSTKKGTFLAKEVKGKKTSYITYKYNGIKAKAQTTYSKTGKVYKKGSKKISKKAFDKYVKKTYKKAKKLSVKKPSPDVSIHVPKDYLYLSKETFVKKDSNGTLVMKHVSGEKTEHYKAYEYSEDGIHRTRFVFGKDKVADWNAFRKEEVNPKKFVIAFSSLLSDPNQYEVIYTQDQETKTGTYEISFTPEYGADYYYTVIVDEKDATPKIKEINEIMSIGAIYESVEFLYGDDAEVDGELYEPGSDAEAYAEGEFASDATKVRTLTVDYEGTTEEAKTMSNYRFEPWTAAAGYTFIVGDKDYLALTLDTDDWYAAERILNPDSGDAGGYAAPTETIKWTAKKPN